MAAFRGPYFERSSRHDHDKGRCGTWWNGVGGVLLGRLSLMMFLQYFVQGAYLPIASVYVERSLGFTPMQVGIFISALAVGPILAPFIARPVGRPLVRDRAVMAVCHIVGGVLMLLLAVQTQVWPVIVLGTVYSILYVPTMMLTQLAGVSAPAEQRHGVPLDSPVRHAGIHRAGVRDRVVVVAGSEGPALDRARAFAFVLSGHRRDRHGAVLPESAAHAAGGKEAGLRSRRGDFLVAPAGLPRCWSSSVS